MNKKKYTSPDFDIVSLTLIDVLTASKYDSTAENGKRSGDDSGGDYGDLGDLLGGN